MDQTFQLKVVSPQDTLFEGKALSVSSRNSAGNFDILPEHANFITIVENSPIVIRPASPAEKITFTFPLAIVYVTNNRATIYAKLESPKL